VGGICRAGQRVFGLTCPTINPILNPVMTKLTDAQKQQIDDLITQTILPALCEDICIADMSDVSKSNSDWDDICEDRMNVLYVEALNYLKNNLL
jgi:hypothetical protein